MNQADTNKTATATSNAATSSKNPGIQFYLCNRLKKFNLDEIQFFLPQLCHLILFSGEPIAALEDFLLFCCGKSMHFAVLMFWQLEAYLCDLKGNSKSNSFAVCRRVHSKCFKLLLPLLSANEDLEDFMLQESLVGEDDDFNFLLEPSILGISFVLGSFGSVELSKDGLHMATIFNKQPRIKGLQSKDANETERESGSSLNLKFSSLDTSQRSSYVKIPTADTALIDANNINTRKSSSNSNSLHKAINCRKKRTKSEVSKTMITDLSMEELETGQAFSFRRFVDKTYNSNGSLNRSLRGLNRPESAPNIHTYSKRRDLVSITAENIKNSAVLNNIKEAFNLNENEDTINPSSAETTYQDEHYFHSELQFIKALEAITKRLVKLPKAARQSSLRAELTLLNHNLPAKVCIPLWCPASMECNVHHVIVRIVAQESVVLNSAEKAPFLMVIEVVETDDDGEIEKLLAFNESSSDEASIDSRRHVGTSSGAAIRNEIPRDTSSEHLPSSNLGSPLMLEAGDLGSDNFYPRMRTAAIMLAQLNQPTLNIVPAVAEGIREKILKEMAFLEEDRMKIVIQQRLERSSSSRAFRREPDVPLDPLSNEEPKENENILDDKLLHSMLKEDPSASVFKENWDMKEERIKDSSPFGQHKGWKMFSVIFKTGSDLRQEQLACQLIREFQSIWQQENVNVWVRYYRVLITSSSTGLIETVSNSISIHSIKKEALARGFGLDGTKVYSLYEHFINEFGPKDSQRFKEAQKKFVKSLAAYSIITYILNIKDRHNGNILIDTEGHIVHIDFGFMLMNSPGGGLKFESAPFKLPQEYIDIIGGLDCPMFSYFKDLVMKAFIACRKHADKIVLLVEMMIKDSQFPCFAGNGALAVSALKSRFETALTDKQVEEFIDGLIIQSHNNMFTRLYDSFQYYSNGIL